MIKIALKHWIYEQCISVLFEEFHKNLILGNYVEKIDEIKIGDKFRIIKEILLNRIDEYYYCTITEIHKDTNRIFYNHSRGKTWTMLNCIVGIER
jgi:hypothetical protein